MQDINPLTTKVKKKILTHLTLWLAAATHNINSVKITHMCNNLKLNICKSWCLNTHFVPNNSNLTYW